MVTPPSAHKVAERVRGFGPPVWGSGDGKVGCASRRRCGHQVTCRCRGASGPPADTRSPGQGTTIRRRNSVMHAPLNTPVRSQTDTNRRSHPQHQNGWLFWTHIPANSLLPERANRPPSIHHQKEDGRRPIDPWPGVRAPRYTMHARRHTGPGPHY